MTAANKNSQGRWLAWCDEHQDGYQGSKRTAEKWAALHDRNRHELAAQA